MSFGSVLPWRTGAPSPVPVPQGATERIRKENENMSHEDLQAYRDRFEEIVAADDKDSDLELSELMTEMMREFNIPMRRNEAYEKVNPEVIQLYREISNTRRFD